jgi:hypothetical protein
MAVGANKPHDERAADYMLANQIAETQHELALIDTRMNLLTLWNQGKIQVWGRLGIGLGKMDRTSTRRTAQYRPSDRPPCDVGQRNGTWAVHPRFTAPHARRCCFLPLSVTTTRSPFGSGSRRMSMVKSIGRGRKRWC